MTFFFLTHRWETKLNDTFLNITTHTCVCGDKYIYIYIYLFIYIVTRYYVLYIKKCFSSDSAFLQYFFKESLYSLGASYLPSRNWKGSLEEAHFNVIVLVLITP